MVIRDLWHSTNKTRIPQIKTSYFQKFIYKKTVTFFRIPEQRSPLNSSNSEYLLFSLAVLKFTNHSMIK